MQTTELRPQNYKDNRPAEHFERFHERARTHDAGWTYSLIRVVATPIATLPYRARAIEPENVPASGPVILASNHFSNMDHFLAGIYLRRKIRFMAKSQLFGNPIGDYIFSVGGVFPVRRGHGDEEAFKTVGAIFERGGCMMIYVEGGRARDGKLGRVRPGVGRAALESGVPVVPVAIHGSQGIRRRKGLNFPKVTIQYGKPRSFDVVESPSREQQLECAEEVFAEIRQMYRGLESEGRAGVLRRLRDRKSASSNPSYS